MTDQYYSFVGFPDHQLNPKIYDSAKMMSNESSEYSNRLLKSVSCQRDGAQMLEMLSIKISIVISSHIYQPT